MHHWDEERVYHDGDQFFSDLKNNIQSAKKSVDLETYIFDQDALGLSIIENLAAAAKRGVRVRLLLDGVGCSQWTNQDLVQLNQSGVHTRFFHPLPWQKPHPHFLRIHLGFWKLNRRNHRKTCVIDEQIAFLGGMNISARQLKQESGKNAWRDTSIRVLGAGVSDIHSAFQHAWTHPQSFRQRWNRYRRLAAHPQLVRLNMTFQQRRSAYLDFLRRLQSATRSIWITSPYFIPQLSLIQELHRAANRGVDVRLVFSEKNDVLGMRWAMHAFYFALLSAGIKIFEYKPSFMHAKIVMIDDWIAVGSSNLNHRSLLHDFEIDAVLNHPQSIQSIQTQFEIDFSKSNPMNLKKIQRRWWIEKLLGRLVLLFKRWI